MSRLRFTHTFILGLAILAAGAAGAEEIDGNAAGIPDAITAAPALPKEFAFTYSLPHGQGDEFPREPAEFDRMLGLLKGAGFNTVHCPYADWRVPLFKKHGMKMMVDVVAWKPPVEADIRRPSQRPKVKAMCESVRGNEAIWGYNLWNERLDWSGSFEYLDAWIRMLRTWDPTHPVWVGTYRDLYCENYKTTPGVFAWHDDIWSGGLEWNFKMLNVYRGIAAKRGGVLGKRLESISFNSDMYSLNTAIAHGVKVAICSTGGPYVANEPDTARRWVENHHLVNVGRYMQSLFGLIGEMGMPYAVYSTPTRRTADNQDKAPGLPADTTAFPADFWLQVTQGEVLCGMFKLPTGADVAYMVNHNASAWQGVVMRVQQSDQAPRVVARFDRGTGQWAALGAVEEISIPLAPAAVEVYRFEPGGAADKIVRAEHAGAAAWDPAKAFEPVGKTLADQGLLAGNVGSPYAVYSTETSLAPGNKPKERGIPAGRKPFPSDFWVQVKQGEVLCGFFKLKDDTDVVCIVNHNPGAWQGMMLLVPDQDPNHPRVISELDLKTGRFQELGGWGDLNFSLAPASSSVFGFWKAPTPKESPLPPPVEQAEWSGIERVVAVGDVHGDYGQFLKALKAGKLIDPELNWIGGKTHLVQTGDVSDRGNGTKKVMDLLMQLQLQAAKAGGMVHVLLGNHELSIMDGKYRDALPGEQKAFGGIDGYRKALSREGKYGQWLRNQSLAIRINDVLFVHAGIQLDWVNLPLAEMNTEARNALKGLPNKHGDRLIGKKSPTWNRAWADTNATAVVSQCDPIFAKLGVRHAVIGHTVQPSITVKGEGRVIAIDTGMTTVFGGTPCALVIENGKFHAVYPGAEPVLLKVDYPEAPDNKERLKEAA